MQDVSELNVLEHEMKTALLIIDMQNGFLGEYQDNSPIEEACEVINYVAGLMRQAGQPVVFVRDTSEAEEMSKADLALTDLLQVGESDFHLEKQFGNAFFDTELAGLLQEQGVGFVILCGQAAEHCVVFTYGGALEQGLKVTVLQEGVLSLKPGRVEMMMQDRNVISHAAIAALITPLD